MNLPLEQQYEYINWRRKIQQTHLRMLAESKAQQSFIAQRIWAYIVSGNDPSTNPEMSADYYYLIDEFGQEFFESENGEFVIHKEEDKDPETTNHYTKLN